MGVVSGLEKVSHHAQAGIDARCENRYASRSCILALSPLFVSALARIAAWMPFAENSSALDQFTVDRSSGSPGSQSALRLITRFLHRRAAASHAPHRHLARSPPRRVKIPLRRLQQA